MRKISVLLLVLFIMSLFSIASAHEGYPVYSSPSLQMLDRGDPPPPEGPPQHKHHHKHKSPPPPEEPRP